MTLRLSIKQHKRLATAAKKMQKAGKAKGRADVIRHLIETYL